MATNSAVVTTSPIRTAAQPTHRCPIRCSTCDIDLVSSQGNIHVVGTTPVALPGSPPCDDMASINLDDQNCRNHSEGSVFPMRCLGMPDTMHSPRPSTSAIANEATGVDDGPTSDTAFSRSLTGTLPSTKITRYLGYVTSIQTKVCSRWLGSLLGLSSLTLAIVSLLMFTLRTYKMAVWTTRNDELQACIGIIQVEHPVGLNCERLISEGPHDPPYHLSRRMTKPGGLGIFSNASDIIIVGTDSFVPPETKSSPWLIFASIFTLVSLADLLLNLLRQTSGTNHDFENLSAIEIATLSHQGQRNTMIHNDDPDARFPVAHTNPSMDIRRRTGQISRTNSDFENLAAIEIATQPDQDQRNTIIDKDHPDARSTVASKGIRRRTGRNRGHLFKRPIIEQSFSSSSDGNLDRPWDRYQKLSITIKQSSRGGDFCSYDGSDYSGFWPKSGWPNVAG